MDIFPQRSGSPLRSPLRTNVRYWYRSVKLGSPFDICEINPEFVEILKRDVLSHDNFASALAARRVRLYDTAVQQLARENPYDFIISGLPLTAFGLHDLRDVFDVVRRSLKPGGVFIITFSNRMFPTKAVRIWKESSDRGRGDLVCSYLEAAGNFTEIKSGFVNPDTSPPRDPLFAVVCHKSTGPS